MSHLLATEARSNRQNGSLGKSPPASRVTKSSQRGGFEAIVIFVAELKYEVAVLRNQSRGTAGELWRHQRRIMAPAFHNKRIAEFVALLIRRLTKAFAADSAGNDDMRSPLLPGPLIQHRSLIELNVIVEFLDHLEESLQYNGNE